MPRTSLVLSFLCFASAASLSCADEEPEPEPLSVGANPQVNWNVCSGFERTNPEFPEASSDILSNTPSGAVVLLPADALDVGSEHQADNIAELSKLSKQYYAEHGVVAVMFVVGAEQNEEVHTNDTVESKRSADLRQAALGVTESQERDRTHISF